MARDAGFSLLELMVALSVFAIIILIGIPGFQSMIQSSREKASRESLFAALELARSEAVTRGTDVIVCQRNAGGDGCDTSDSWGQGWLVETGAGEVLQVWDPMKSGVALAVAGGGDIVYTPQGAIRGAARTFTLTVADNTRCFRLGMTGAVSTVTCP